MNYRLEIEAVIENVRRACEFVVALGKAHGLDDTACYHCDLAVEEICTNIIEHGYKYNGSQAVIELQVAVLPNCFKITVVDDAPPFNPLAASSPDPSMSLEERVGGGWGVVFAKKFLDLSYEYRDGKNHMVMCKRY